MTKEDVLKYIADHPNLTVAQFGQAVIRLVTELLYERKVLMSIDGQLTANKPDGE